MQKLFWGGLVVGLSALAFACSSSSAVDGDCSGNTCDCTGNCTGDDDIAHQDAGADATLDGNIPPCDYGSPTLAAACPLKYSYTYAGQACSPVGTQCYYPGAGDEVNGCYASAELICQATDAGIYDAGDAGDASVGAWTYAQ